MSPSEKYCWCGAEIAEVEEGAHAEYHADLQAEARELNALYSTTQNQHA